MTDGRSRDKNETLVAARRLKQAQIARIFSIGIGDPEDLDREELEAIASQPSNVFEVDNFDALETIQDQLQRATCEGTSE